MEIEVLRSRNTVVVTYGELVGVSRARPGDKFDISTGIGVALVKASTRPSREERDIARKVSKDARRQAWVAELGEAFLPSWIDLVARYNRVTRADARSMIAERYGIIIGGTLAVARRVAA